MEERSEQIAQALDGVIEAGESWVVRAIQNEILVEPYEAGLARSKIGSKIDPELEARMLHVNDQLSSAGCGVAVFSILIACGVCLGLHMKWFDTLIGPAVAKVQNIWVYIFAIVTTFVAMIGYTSLAEKIRYRRYRHELMGAVRKAGLTPPALLAEIKESDDYSNLVNQMKADPEFFSF